MPEIKEKLYIVKVVGTLYIDGNIENISFTSEKKSALPMSENEAIIMRDVLFKQEKLNCIIEAV